LYSLEFWLGKHETHGPLFQTTIKGKPKVDPIWVWWHPSDALFEMQFLECVAELAPADIPITQQLKTKLILHYLFDAHLRLMFSKYKFYAKGAHKI
jgi:hypothetical protein